MSYNGHKNHATWLLHVWEVIPVLANEANEQSCLPEWEGVTWEWCYEAFCDWYARDIFSEDGIIQDLLNSVIQDIDWHSIAEDVKEYINENYKQQ